MTTDLLRDSTTIPLRIQALEEILHHATEKHAQIVKRQGGASGGSSDDDGGDESGSSGGSNRYGGKREYKWSPLDVLCASCFRPVLQNHFYAWWINERMSERVERTCPPLFRLLDRKGLTSFVSSEGVQRGLLVWQELSYAKEVGACY